MAERSRHISVIDGETYVSATMLLVMVADAAHGRVQLADHGAQQRATHLLNSLVAEARIGGFEAIDVLETVLQLGKRDDRSMDFIEDAVSYMGGPEALMRALVRAGCVPKPGDVEP